MHVIVNCPSNSKIAGPGDCVTPRAAYFGDSLWDFVRHGGVRIKDKVDLYHSNYVHIKILWIRLSGSLLIDENDNCAPLLFKKNF